MDINEVYNHNASLDLVNEFGSFVFFEIDYITKNHENAKDQRATKIDTTCESSYYRSEINSYELLYYIRSFVEYFFYFII